MSMHYLAGILLVVDFALMWVLDKPAVPKALDYGAMATWLAAMILIALPQLALRVKGQVPPGGSFVNTGVLVDSGIYAVVRHPLYLGWMLMYLVVWLFNPNLILAGIGLLGVYCVYTFTKQEEQLLLAKFGESYEHYIQSVPGFNLPAGIIRRFGKRGGS